MEASSTGRSARQPPVETSQSTGFREVTDRQQEALEVSAPSPGTGRPLPPRRLPHSRVCFQAPQPKSRGRSSSSPPNTQQDVVEESRASRVGPPDFFRLCDLELVPLLWSLIVLLSCCLVDKSCPTPCDPMACSPPGSSVPGIFPGSGLPFPPSGDFPTQGLNPRLPNRQVALPLSQLGNHSVWRVANSV